MSFLDKLKGLVNPPKVDPPEYEELCTTCELNNECICPTCPSDDCKGGGDCAKNKPITHCTCKECGEKHNCSTCTPDIH